MQELQEGDSRKRPEGFRNYSLLFPIEGKTLKRQLPTDELVSSW